VTVRPLVSHAAGVLRDLHNLREGGRITWDTWLTEVSSVAHGIDAGLTVRPEYASLLPASTLPAVTDTPEQVAAEHVAWLPNLHVPDVPSVKGHRQ